VEILLWLVPSAVVAVLTMLWVGWVGRDRPEEVDRDAAVARLASALTREHPARHAPRPAPERDRSRGIAVRPSRLPGGDGRRAS
jgi:hypothetical protein